MTLDKFRRIDLRLDKAYGYIPDNQFAKQGDYNGIELVVQLADNGVVKDQSGTQLLFKWGHNQRKNSGQKYFEALDLSQGVFKVTYPTQMLFEGTVTATIHIIQDGNIIPTRNFTLRVEKDPTNDNLVVAENDFSVLQEALLQVNEWNGKFEEKYNGLEEEYNEEINSLNRQLAHIDKKGNTELRAIRERKALITIIDDDGRNEVIEKWEPLLQEKNFKLDIAVITSMPNNHGSYLSWSELDRLAENYPVTLLNHSHEDYNLSELSEKELRYQFEMSKKELMSRGHTNGDIIVYPRGRTNHEARTIVSEYFRAGVFNLGGTNYPPLYTFNLRRWNLLKGDTDVQDIETLKGYVDNAIAGKGWLILMSHAQHSGLDTEVVSELIDYVNLRHSEIEWVHTNEGLDKIGNIIDIGDNEDTYNNGVPEDVSYPYRVIDAEGITHSNIDNPIYRIEDVTYNTPITDFPRNQQSFSYILTSNETADLFPRGGGTLETFHGANAVYSYQRFKPYNNNELYQRRWVNDSWTDFERVNSDIDSAGVGHLFNTPPSEFKNNNTTVSIITTANADGFPDGAGTLITYRYGGFQYTYQTYKPSAFNKLYIRSSNGNGTSWNVFAEM